MTETIAVDGDAERAVLGALMIMGDARYVAGLATRGLRAEDFYYQQHGVVFTGMVSLSDRQAAIDTITVAGELDRLGLRGIVTRGQIDELTGYVPAAGNYRDYADRVMDLARWRGRKRAAQAMSEAIERRDSTAWLRARSDLDSATAGTRTESLSPEQWGATLFDFFSASEEEANAYAIPLPFARLSDALGGGLWPGEVFALSGPTSHGKALALTTPILTPVGWSTMGDLRVGDEVFGADGRPTRVAITHPVLLGSDCYEVRFSDGATLVADADHLWRYEVGERVHVDYRREGGVRVRDRIQHHVEVIDSTVALGAAIEATSRSPRVRLGAPLERPTATDLPIDPYVLGVWLGDGASRTGNVTSHVDDVEEIASYLRAVGEAPIVSCYPGRAAGIRLPAPRPDLCARGHVRRGRWNRCDECRRARYRGEEESDAWNVPLVTRLTRMDLAYPNPKRIPEEYLSASRDQRLALLQGLVDTDGSVDRYGGVEFCSISRRLTEQVIDLILSLGASPRLYEKSLVAGKRGTDRAWRVFFRMELPAARLARKRERFRALNDRKRYRYVKSVTLVESIPVRCITVKAEDGMFLAGRSLVPTHNSIVADMWLDHAADRGKACHLYMTEMTAISRGLRYLARRTGVPFMRQRRRALTDQDRSKILAELGRMPYGCTVAADWSIDDVVRDALRARYDFVVVDLLHGFHYEDERGLDKLSKAMQRLAHVSTTIDGHNGTAVLALTHLKEEGLVKGKVPKPTITSIKGGSSIKQDAEFVGFVWQDQDDSGALTGEAEVWIPKGRTGQLERLEVRLNPSRFRFDLRQDELGPEGSPAAEKSTGTDIPF